MLSTTQVRCQSWLSVGRLTGTEDSFALDWGDKVRRLLLVASLVVAILVATPAAGSADAPLNDDPCGALKQPEVTKGLYGLCMAFCTGADCAQQNCTAGNARILALYNARMKATDPGMPCLPLAHPCWSAAELAAVGSSWSPHIVNYLETLVPGVYSSYTLVENRSGEFGAYTLVQVDVNDAGSIVCRYFYADFGPDAAEPVIRVLEVTEEQGMVALNELLAQAQRLRDAGVCIDPGCPVI